jgi:chromatin remodeling complex protein RSC6
MESELATIHKEIAALRKDIRKLRQLIEDPNGEKANARSKNNGFNKPLNVSADLKKFLGLGDGEQISRADVTRRLNEYVTSHNLKNGRTIILDDTLRALLNPPEGVEVTFLNIQKYINPHYIKDVPAEPVPVPVEPVVEKKKPTLRKK